MKIRVENFMGKIQVFINKRYKNTVVDEILKQRAQENNAEVSYTEEVENHLKVFEKPNKIKILIEIVKDFLNKFKRKNHLDNI